MKIPKESTWAEVLMAPFAWIGYFLYWVIGLPIAGIYIGWIIARDHVMTGEKE